MSGKGSLSRAFKLGMAKKGECLPLQPTPPQQNGPREWGAQTAGYHEGAALAGGVQTGWGPFLLVVSTEPGAELHEGGEGVASGGRQRQVGLQHPLQQCQHLLFLHLQGCKS